MSIVQAQSPVECDRFHRRFEDGFGPAGARYLELLKCCLTRRIFEETYLAVNPSRSRTWWRLSRLLRALLTPFGLELVRRVPIAERERVDGKDWPMTAETMIGPARLDHLQTVIADVVRRGVPGDLIETGVWRGGATIFMRAVLEVLGDDERTVWVADSFRGLPKPNAGRFPADKADRHHRYSHLAVGVDEVKYNFARYGLLDERVRFLVGWFSNTLPAAPIDRLAVLRVDGDMYESTHDALVHLYPRLSQGGYAIIDDYGILQSCRAAVDDYRARHAISEPLSPIDHAAVYWRRENST